MASQYLSHLASGKVIGLPSRFENAVITDVPKDELARAITLDYARAWPRVVNDGFGMLQLGVARSWKSYSTAALCRLVTPRGVGVAWVDVPADFARFNIERYSEWSQHQRYVWTSIQMLVLDDFATIEPGSFGHELLGAIVSARFNAQLPTHFTANLEVTPDTVWKVLHARYGAMIVRRIEDMTTGYRSISS